MRRHTGYLMLIIAGPVLCQAHVNRYSWLKGTTPKRTIASGVGVPAGFRRAEVPGGSFADWLRHLPLKAPDAPVLLYNGKQKANQQVHAAVLDIDTGTRNLQQCADAVIRLRAEYLFSRGLHEAVHFNFTSGHRAFYVKWAAGFRPVLRTPEWTFEKTELKSFAPATDGDGQAGGTAGCPPGNEA
jgi:hypothetical protein